MIDKVALFIQFLVYHTYYRTYNIYDTHVARTIYTYNTQKSYDQRSLSKHQFDTVDNNIS